MKEDSKGAEEIEQSTIQVAKKSDLKYFFIRKFNKNISTKNTRQRKIMTSIKKEYNLRNRPLSSDSSKQSSPLGNSPQKKSKYQINRDPNQHWRVEIVSNFFTQTKLESAFKELDRYQILTQSIDTKHRCKAYIPYI